MTSGGSSETELSALTVIPKGRCPSSAVTTVTPVTKWPITRRNVSESIASVVGVVISRGVYPRTPG